MSRNVGLHSGHDTNFLSNLIHFISPMRLYFPNICLGFSLYTYCEKTQKYGYKKKMAAKYHYS